MKMMMMRQQRGGDGSGATAANAGWVATTPAPRMNATPVQSRHVHTVTETGLVRLAADEAH